MLTKVEREILRIKNKTAKRLKDTVVEEISLPIRINDTTVFELECSPIDLEELITGFLFSEGFVKNLSEISKIDINYHEVRVTLNKLNKKNVPKPIKNNFVCSPDMLYKLMQDFQSKSSLFKETGGVHSAALAKKSKIIFFYEDVSRHSAIDKVIGKACKEEVSFSDKILLTSGRIAAKVVSKAAMVGLPMIVSKAAVTNSAIQLAERLNLAVIGFVRGQRMNVYTCPQNLKY